MCPYFWRRPWLLIFFTVVWALLSLRSFNISKSYAIALKHSAQTKLVQLQSKNRILRIPIVSQANPRLLKISEFPKVPCRAIAVNAWYQGISAYSPPLVLRRSETRGGILTNTLFWFDFFGSIFSYVYIKSTKKISPAALSGRSETRGNSGEGGGNSDEDYLWWLESF